MKLVILGIIGMAVSMGYPLLVQARVFYAGLVPVGILFFVVYLMTSTKYIIRSRELLVGFGPFRFHYPFSAIVSVKRGTAFGNSNQPASVNFTFSTDHLVIQLKSGLFRAVTISPRDQGRFLRLLSARGIKVEGSVPGWPQKPTHSP